MPDEKSNNKVIGIIGIILGLFCLGSFLIGDNAKLIIPLSSLFLVKYSVVICIINGGLYFSIVGILGLMGIIVPTDALKSTEYKRRKAKGFLISAVLLSPLLLSFFTTVFVLSESALWKVLGSLALIYAGWLVYSNITVLKEEGGKKGKA